MLDKETKLVKVHNDLIRIDTSGYTLTEKRYLMALLYLAKDKPAGTWINLRIEDLKRLGIYRETTNVSYEMLEKHVRSIGDKLAALYLRFIKDDKKSFYDMRIPLFDRVDTSGTFGKADSLLLSIRISSTAMPYLNKILKNYTSFPLLQYQELKSKHSQDLYLRLMQFYSTGWSTLSRPQLLADLGLAQDYSERNLNHVLKGAISELSDKKIFKGLKVSKTYGSKRKATAYKFQWLVTLSPEDLAYPSDSVLWDFLKNETYGFLRFDYAKQILKRNWSNITNWKAYLKKIDYKMKQQYEPIARQIIDDEWDEYRR